MARAKRYIQRGELALYEDGMSSEQVDEFLSRQEIQLYLSSVYQDFVDKDGRRQRVTYFTLAEVEKLAAPAINIVMRALVGYKEADPDDPDSRETIPPSEQQLRTAESVLDRLGIKVTGKDDAVYGSNPLTNIMNNINISVNPDVADSTTSTEKVLAFVEMFVGNLQKKALDSEKGIIDIPRLPDREQQREGEDILNKLKAKNGKSSREKKRRIREIESS